MFAIFWNMKRYIEKRRYKAFAKRAHRHTTSFCDVLMQDMKHELTMIQVTLRCCYQSSRKESNHMKQICSKSTWGTWFFLSYVLHIIKNYRAIHYSFISLMFFWWNHLWLRIDQLVRLPQPFWKILFLDIQIMIRGSKHDPQRHSWVKTELEQQEQEPP